MHAYVYVCIGIHINICEHTYTHIRVHIVTGSGILGARASCHHTPLFRGITVLLGIGGPQLAPALGIHFVVRLGIA